MERFYMGGMVFPGGAVAVVGAVSSTIVILSGQTLPMQFQYEFSRSTGLVS